MLPVTLALMRFAKPAPGSKNPEPEDEVPVTLTVAEAWPAATEPAEDGCAGGGATSLTTSTP